MWRFKPFMPKEQTGLEGRTIDIGNLKVQIRNVIAEGGFSCVYLARDVHSSKLYAIKHIICNDKESLDLVMKEISVMKLLRGHPNIVALLAHTILDMGRTKEALLVMDFCEKSLVNVLESRGAGYFEEKQILSIFRDVCNAVFAMHCVSPPIAHRSNNPNLTHNETAIPNRDVNDTALDIEGVERHVEAQGQREEDTDLMKLRRDLKAENLLLGPDGMWKLCDFGSTSTNHKHFERPEEMGIEEDNIRKHTTPAYRAPEMWDLFRRELISEKVDIWVWFRVNEQLPVELQKSLPDSPPDMLSPAADLHESISNPTNKAPPMPRRSPPPPPPSREQVRNASPPSLTSSAGGDGNPLGAFWSTQHAKDSLVAEDKGGPVFDEGPTSQRTSKHDRRSPENRHHLENASHLKEQNVRARPLRGGHANSLKSSGDDPSKDFEIRFFPEDEDRGTEKTKVSQSESIATFQNEVFNTFVAEFDTSKLDSGNKNKKSGKEEALEAEVDILKKQLKHANLEKAEIASKYEKLSAICRSQRHEIQELKQALSTRTPSPNRDALKDQNSPGSSQSATPPQSEKLQGTVWELQQGTFANSSPSPDSKSWKAFPEDPKPKPLLKNTARSVRTTNGHQNKQTPAVSSGLDTWGFGTESFTAVPASSQVSRIPGQGNNSQHFGDSKNLESKPASQPAGWAGF
ncbi:hypothetical protein HHK36_017678 [Tetracentron sinense]|uniref:non-specific serine/threonine protein kinase n=1 Tax=Tetracentron sinense TaxID=13715 RepID=A0A834Z2F1_TETSI|nr:hypothetical protein HHK36_017678 [Tetracentron sinense]